MPNYSGPTTPTIDSEYAVKQNEKVRSDNPNSDWFVVRSMQQHHDYYVQKYLDAEKEGKQLSAKELKEYNLAMLREKQGQVNPLVH